MIKSALIPAVLCALISSPRIADAVNPVDALVITGLDVSSSINATETQLQVDGMAEALRSPSVLSAIQAGPRHSIAVLIFVWADGEMPVLLDWRVIASQEDADQASAEIQSRLQEVIAQQAKIGTLTNLSGALDRALSLLSQAPVSGDRVLVNIAGNGDDNAGEGPADARQALLSTGATINGVVIGGDPAVINYYRHNVIGGKSAFVLTAAKPEDLVSAFVSKFVSEIASR